MLILYVNYHQLNLFNYGIINSAYRESGNVCKLTLAKEPLPMFIPSCAGLSKSGPYTKAIDQQLIFDITITTLICLFLVSYYASFDFYSRMLAQIEIGLIDNYFKPTMVCILYADVLIDPFKMKKAKKACILA